MQPFLCFLTLLLLSLCHADDSPAHDDPSVGPGHRVGPGASAAPEIWSADGDIEPPIVPAPRFPTVEDFLDLHVITRFVHNDGVTVKHYEEFFDFDNKRGRLDVMAEGIPSEIELLSSFYMSGRNQIIEIRTGKHNVSCKVEPMDPSALKPVTDLVDFDPVEKYVIYGPMAIWKWVVRRMNSDKPLIQINGAKVNGSLRGREVWFYEFQDTEKEIDVNIVMYFLESGDTKVEVPIQFEIKGSENGQIVVDRYEFLLFEDYLNEDLEILPAIGAGCEGVKAKDDFEKLVSQMSILSADKVGLDVEIVQQVEGENVKFDHRMIMDNFDKLLYLTSREADNDVSYIEDLQRGITYVQVNDENCQADPLESIFTSYSHSLSFAKGLKQILNLDGSDYYFLGQTKKRGLSVQVWERVIWDLKFTTFDEPAEGVLYKKAVITHFLSDDSDVDMETSSIVPVQTLLTGYEENEETGKLFKKFTQELNYFEVHEIPTDDTSSEQFDVSNCFPRDEQRRHFDLFLKTEGSGSPNHSFAKIERMVARELAQGADISILRIPRVEVTSAGHFTTKEGSGLVLNLLLLEKPTPLSLFKNMSVTLKPHKGDERVQVSPKECATQAIQKNAKKPDSCSGFFLCGDTCYLTDWTLSDEGREVLDDEKRECTFFQRNVMNSKDLTAELTLAEATDLLFVLTAEGKLFFNPEGTGEGSDNYIVENLMITRPRQELVESRSFDESVADHTLIESDATVTISGRSVLSFGDCVSACDQEAAMLCESFAFCSAAGKCILSPSTITLNSTDITPSDSCDIYTRTYTSLYTSIDGSIATAKTDQIRQVSNEEECARTCSSLTDFKCQSFAFCGTSHCVLKEAHAFATDLSEEKEKQDGIECDLFTVKHFSDFIPTANVIVGGDALQTIEKLSVDECAARCSATTNCRSINFCHSSAKTPASTCDLMAVSPADSGAQRNRHPGCWNYRRASATPTGNGKQIPGGYRGASLTWLVIGMIITGAVLGIAGLLAYGHYRARSGQSVSGGGLGLSIPSVRWSRQKDEE